MEKAAPAQVAFLAASESVPAVQRGVTDVLGVQAALHRKPPSVPALIFGAARADVEPAMGCFLHKCGNLGKHKSVR